MSKDSFLEIEHKFLVSKDFDRHQFQQRLRSLPPLNEYAVQVEDRYFVGCTHEPFVLRHRCDEKIQQLTLKSLGEDPEFRTEINLNLDQKVGSQWTAVESFAGRLGADYLGCIKKSVQVFEFEDAEVVFYRAEGPDREIDCVEVESLIKTERSAALTVLHRYEEILGLDPVLRSHQSLVELLLGHALKKSLSKQQHQRH